MVEAIREGDIPGVQLRRRQTLGIPVEEAWQWLVDPARLVRWLAAKARVEPGARGHLQVESTAEDGSLLREQGSTLEFEPPRRWVLAFQKLDAGWPAATRLILELAPRPGGCEISALQQGFEQLPLSSCLTIWEEYRRRWHLALSRLAEVSAP